MFKTIRMGLVLFIVCGGCERAPLTDGVAVFGELGMGDGAFSYPRAIAVSPTGKLFIVDKTARVQRFDADGVFETSKATSVGSSNCPSPLPGSPKRASSVPSAS